MFCNIQFNLCQKQILEQNIFDFKQKKSSLFLSVVFTGIFFLFLSTNIVAQGTDDFVITVKTDNPGTSSDTSFTIPTIGYGYAYSVDCNNDGIEEVSGVTGDYTCNYSTPGTYTIRIKRADGGTPGTSWYGFPRIYFNNSGDKDKILSVNQWGMTKWTSMEKAFFGCTNLNSAPVVGGTGEPDWATDAPDLSNVTSLDQMFHFAVNFNQPVNHWDTHTITNMRAVFRNDTANYGMFNQPLDNWNTDNVTNMYEMFYGAKSFNQPIGNWNTENVTNMRAMFFYAINFNQPIGNWNTGKVVTMVGMFWGARLFNQPIGNWNTGKVEKMWAMFAAAENFNQPIGNWNTSSLKDIGWMFWYATKFNQDISNWNTSKIIRMTDAFAGDTAFDQNLGSWDVTSLRNAAEMFGGVKLSRSNYDALLIGWSAQNLNHNVPFDGGYSIYCFGQDARNKLINDFNWSITDGGNGGCKIPLSNNAVYLLIAFILLFVIVKMIRW